MDLEKKESRYHIVAAITSLSSLMIIGTILFHFLEKWTWAQSFYFSSVTLTTVGYGDLYPTTDLSRIITAFYVLIGVGTALASITVIATDKINKKAGKIKDRVDSKNLN